MDQTTEALIAAAIIILVSFPVHEFSHAWMAYRLGDSTARYLGRLTLNPIVHFDPLGGLMLLVTAYAGYGMGWAKPTPVNFLNLRNGRTGEAHGRGGRPDLEPAPGGRRRRGLPDPVRDA